MSRLLRPFRCAPAIALLLLACGGGEAAQSDALVTDRTPPEFDGAKAMAYVRAQMAFGPRVPGTAAHRNAGDWLVSELRERADTVLVQTWTHVTADGKRLPMRNVLARFNPAASDRVLYLAHWDSRPTAEKATNPADRGGPTPGANDGASGVAVLLGVADALKAQPAGIGVDLLFVDGEDWGDFDTDTDVLIGSRHFVANLPRNFAPRFGVLFDMVGKPDARFLYESHSMRAAPDVIQLVWGAAQRLGHGAYFPTRESFPITDDHLPFIEKGFKVIDVIDIDYAYHHTPEDTEDKVSERTLQVVGDVAMAVLRAMR
ncbi:MAG: M28 family peptidase [Gemmatimonadaceae bacterium]|nr:M28 family peptidase [Gemmatimonadaceae bacterium]MCW5826675.1 M28 family peptidase [Gemmatimonadaceae bacterium]